MEQQLEEIIRQSDNIVFLGGAGVSTESGIPDFRSQQGLWQAKTKYGCSPEKIVSNSFFLSRTNDFYKFYFSNMVYPQVKPNITHLALAELERQGKLKMIVTQNIDGLHQAAGSKNVCELHGSVWRNFCQDCGRRFTLPYIMKTEHQRQGTCIPVCEHCGGVIKPDVVLFEEPLDNAVMERAIRAIAAADTMIVGGTSLVVYPAAGLLRYFSGRRLVLINLETTPFDKRATLVLHKALGEVFGA